MVPAIAGGLVAGGLNLIGDIVSQTNARSAFKSRYQDTVADMRKAGLNPALAYGQGGGNPQTSDFGDIGSAVAAGAQNAQSARLLNAQAKLLERQSDDLALTTEFRRREANFRQDTAGTRAQMTFAEWERQQATNQEEIARRKANSAFAVNRAEAARLGLPQARAYSKYYEGPIGKAEPYTESARQWVGTAADAWRAAKGGNSGPLDYRDDVTSGRTGEGRTWKVTDRKYRRR